MLTERDLHKSLADLPLGGVRFFEQTGSTNDAALAWAADNAPNLALVCADEQTRGRGRGGHTWFTPPGAALAFSLVLRPQEGEELLLSLFSGLGALAVCEALEGLGLHPQIKWPNDVLLGGRKVCGVLPEAVWLGDQLDSVALGIGVNVTPEAVPPPERLAYPATCVETEAGRRVERPALLRQMLLSLLRWRGLVAEAAFLTAWQARLAFRGQPVEVRAADETRGGLLDGLEADGSLRLVDDSGQAFSVHFGEVHLRPVV